MIRVDETAVAEHTVHIKVHYDSLPKYYKVCKLQGHKEEERRKLQPRVMEKAQEDGEDMQQSHDSICKPLQVNNKFPPKVLSSG